MSPNKGGQCVRFEVEYLRGWWRNFGRTDCVALSERSHAIAYLPYSNSLRGLRLRFGVEFSGDELNRPDTSNWIYARYSS